ncbi:type II toxin-antitoxin system RelE family toxin [Desulfoplanes sp.]
MEISFKKRFIKDLHKIPAQPRNVIEDLVFTTIPQVNTINELHAIKKIQGFSSFYRLRIGDYRIGIKITNNKIVCYRVLHRKDIYKYFP